jgi:putative ABC transport system substrate-binding protein
LVNASSGDFAFLQQRETETAGVKLGVKILPATVRVPNDLDTAFRMLKERRASAVIILNDGMFVVQRQRIVSLASAARLPDLYSFRDGVIAGGLLSYGVNVRENFRKGAALVIKILEGASPAQMPVEFPSKLELVINLKTAKSLGLTIPPQLLARADEVIE